MACRKTAVDKKTVNFASFTSTRNKKTFTLYCNDLAESQAELHILLPLNSETFFTTLSQPFHPFSIQPLFVFHHRLR
jgi:hypothetical protein